MRFPPPARDLARLLQQVVQKGCVVLAALLLAQPAAFAATPTPQDDYFVRNWRVADGLPHNSVSRIVQDSDGFLWIATPGGLARFDGVRFQEYPLPLAPPDGNLSIRDLAIEDEDTLVMVTASAGVLRLRKGEFSMHPVNTVLRGRQLHSLFVEPSGTLWIIAGQEIIRWSDEAAKIFGEADGISRRGHQPSFAIDERGRTWIAAAEYLGYFEGGALHRYHHDYGVVKIAPARSGGFWIATPQQLLRMKQGVLQSVLEGAEWTAATFGLHDFTEDATGMIWTASRRRGLWRLAGKTMVPTPLSQTQAVAVTEDGEGNTWVATTGGGLSRLRPRTFIQLDSAAGMPDVMSTSVCEDVTGTLWCANRSGGLIRWREDAFTRAGRGLYVNTVSPRPGGGAWVGAQEGLFRIGPGKDAEVELVSRELTDVRALLTTRSGDVWVASGRRRLGYFRGDRYHPLTPETGYDHWQVAGIAEDPSGGIHVVSNARASYEWTGSALELRVAADKMPGGRVYSLHVDEQGTFWYGTSTGLVIRRGNRLDLLSAAHGLPDNMIFQTVSGDMGRLWCGSRRGIFSVDRQELLAVADGRLREANAIAVGRAHGLVGASALNGLQPMSWKATDGRLWFATHAGLVGIDPAPTLPSPTPPRIHLDQVIVDGVRRSVEGTLLLGPGEHQVEIQFAALNFSNPEHIRIRHRLVGYDTGWVETDSQRRVQYSRLPAGRYTLQAMAANEDGRWGEAGVMLPIAVAPWWWQTWWAMASGIVLSASMVAWVARRWSHGRLKARLQHLGNEHALERERARIARDLHDDLGGSLTKIGMLADRLRRQASDPELKPKLGQLAWHTRRLTGELESIVWTVSPKNNTWERLAVYIAQFTPAFFRDTPVAARVEGENGIPPLPLTPDAQYHVLAILREALNNALKHSHATVVEVRLAADENQFTLRIRDNGIGFDPAAPEHAERNGLSNLRCRANELDGSLEIDSRNGGGSAIVLRLNMTAAPLPRDRSVASAER